jgi:tyrosyl-tRNA synthetase
MSAAIQTLLTRGTVDVIVREDLEKKLKGKKKLRVKLGIDPSGADLHIGHMVVIRKLKQFQDLGHQVVLLFGNFTGQIGDPTGKSETRAPKTQEELEKNAKHYLDQVAHVLDVKKIEVVWNADWLSKLTFADVVKLSSSFTVARMLERDMFQDRIAKKLPISMHEFLYPLMQGYDSVPIKADVELGGTDQTFNLLAGRTIQKAYGMAPQNVLTVPILEGLDGKIKMGKSEDNFIAVADKPTDMYGKTMSIPDELILRYFELTTDVSMEEIASMGEAMKKGENPRNIKMRLARELVAIYHDEKAAEKAEAQFVNVFAKNKLPDDIPEKTFKVKKMGIIDLLFEGKLVASKSEARRLIQGGGVRVDSEKVTSIELVVPIPKSGVLVQVGKRRFLTAKSN